MRIKYTGCMRMNPAFNINAAKKPTNVSVNGDLLAKAKEMKINLSATLETALSELVSARQRELWKLENKTAIEAYNQMVEEHGTFSDDLRSF
jgi:antitoxin CcdA